MQHPAEPRRCRECGNANYHNRDCSKSEYENTRNDTIVRDEDREDEVRESEPGEDGEEVRGTRMTDEDKITTAEMPVTPTAHDTCGTRIGNRVCVSYANHQDDHDMVIDADFDDAPERDAGT